MNDLIVTNTIFQHKEIYKFIKELRNRKEKSFDQSGADKKK